VLWESSEAEVRTVFNGVDFVRHGPNTPSDVDDFLVRLAAARVRGYSVVDEEAEPGLYSLAVPVRDFTGEVAAALQIVGTRARLEPRRTECAAALVEQGRWLEARLGYVPRESSQPRESYQPRNSNQA
jgi:IclR family pca regulon transcriptional regulator